MAMRFENLAASVCFVSTCSFVETQTVGAAGLVFCGSERSVVVSSVHNRGRRYFGDLFVARIPSEQSVLRNLKGEVRRKVASLASDLHLFAFEHREAEPSLGLNPKDALRSPVLNPLRFKEGDDNGDSSATEGDSEDEDGEPTATAAPWMSEEEAKTVVSEVLLNGDELSVVEYPANEEEQPDTNPLNSIADSLLNKINEDGRGFSLTEVGGIWKTGEDAGEVKVPDLSLSGFDIKDGVSPLAQWTSTELTMQHSQLARIATDVRYLQNAFAFFGAVRVVEALMSVFSTSPPDFGKLKELLNALDPFTIAWLAHNLRKPIVGMVNVDPLDLEKVITLKSHVWEELHKFYERQWKVMATIAMARTLGIVASHVPAAEVVTSKVKFLWDALMALPVF